MADTRHWLIPESPFRSYREYQDAQGGSALEATRRRPTQATLEEIRASGLRGRGGAGFPVAAKWESVRSNACEVKYVVANCAEGEPGTFKDRWLIRHNPYAVVEGLLVAANVVGARAGWLALKASFTEEIAALERALDEMAGALGGVELAIVRGPEDYLFGEERALLEVIEGNDPLPRTPDKPPYEWGLFATRESPNPAVVNNAQTLAHAATIALHGGKSFRRFGTEDTPGTLLFTLSGDVTRPGVYEAEAGTPLEALLQDFGGGPRPGRAFKALLCGVSAPVIAADQFKTPADFGSLAHIGSALGSAGFIAIDDATSIPRVAQAVAAFLFAESCNQCSACKAGLGMASRSLDELFDPAQATPDDFEHALYGARTAPQGNRCYLPVQGSLLIPSLMHRYKDEFDAQLARPGEPSAVINLREWGSVPWAGTSRRS